MGETQFLLFIGTFCCFSCFQTHFLLFQTQKCLEMGMMEKALLIEHRTTFQMFRMLLRLEVKKTLNHVFSIKRPNLIQGLIISNIEYLVHEYIIFRFYTYRMHLLPDCYSKTLTLIIISVYCGKRLVVNNSTSITRQ